MADYGANVADKTIATVERKLRVTYRTAQKELKAKLNDFVRKSAERDRRKRKLLDEGKISKQDYANWKAGQIFQQKQWEAKVKEVAAVMTHSNEQAARIINESRLNVFSENYNFSAFVGEQQVGISFDVYNTQAVARMIKDDPQVLPEWKIDEQKDYEWNYKKINNIVQQGIIQGEGIPEIADRLCRDLSTQNENKMRMFARTAITGAQNAGRQQQMEDAAGMGIKVEKQWIATLDSRTRDWHRDRDGETVPYNEEFSGGLEYPGDPAGEPADVFNCRCTMISVYPDHAAHHERGARRAYAEYEDATGYHRRGYATTNPNVFERWSDKAYRRWLDKKQEQIDLGEVKAFGFTKFTNVDFDNQYKAIETPENVTEIIDSASETITKDFPKIENYIRNIGYGNTGDAENPARCERYIPKQPPYNVGMVISINKELWKTNESITAYLKRMVTSNYHIKSNNPASIIMHEYGHGIHFACALKRVGYNGFGALTQLQKEQQGVQFELIAADIKEIIKNTKDGLTNDSALENVYEYIGEAFADYYYGEKHEVSKRIVKYFMQEGF